MNIFEVFGERVRAAVRAIEPGAGEADLSRLTVEPPREASHGDIATNAAMVLAKALGAKPRDLAERIAGALQLDADVASVLVAGPGFINMTLGPRPGRGYSRPCWPPTERSGCRRQGRESASTSSLSRPIRRDPCMSATAAAPSLGTLSRHCSLSAATT